MPCCNPEGLTNIILQCSICKPHKIACIHLEKVCFHLKVTNITCQVAPIRNKSVSPLSQCWNDYLDVKQFPSYLSFKNMVPKKIGLKTTAASLGGPEWSAVIFSDTAIPALDFLYWFPSIRFSQFTIHPPITSPSLPLLFCLCPSRLSLLFPKSAI